MKLDRVKMIKDGLLEKKIDDRPKLKGFSEKLTESKSKGKEFMFNKDDVRIPYILKKSVRKGKELNPLGKIPTDVWPKNNHTTSKEYAGWHPTQKPLELLERIIKAHTNQGDVVLDCFSGSGSTAIASINTNREFIGCELDEEYFTKSMERINELTGVNRFI